MTWHERLQSDPTLQAFVSAELTRAGIELDTLRYQHDWDRQRIAVLQAQLAAVQRENERLRRRLGRTDRLPDLEP